MAAPKVGESQLFFRKLLVLLATLAVLAFLFAVRRLLLLLGFGVLFAYVADPIVSFVERALLRWRVGPARLLSVALVYLAAIGALALAGLALLPRVGRQLERLSLEAPAIAAALQGRFERGLAWYRSQPMPDVLRDAIDQVGARAGPAATAFVGGIALRLTAILPYLPWLVLIPVLAFFLLKDATGFQALVLRLMPPGRARWRAGDFIKQVNEVLATYVRVQLLVALFVATASGLLLALAGIQFWLLLAVAAAILEFIPMLGPALFTLTAGVVAANQGRAVLVVLGLIVLRMLVDYLVSPALIRKGLRLHPLAILLALLCGSQLAGIAGLFLAIPLMAVGVVAYRYVLLQSGSMGLLASLLQSTEPSDVPALVLATASGVREPSASSLKDAVVLVVDNEADARETVALVLQTYGARVIEADCGVRALEILQSDRPDVLISDIGMPHEDGLDLIRKLRALPSVLRGIPAIALTGYGTIEDRDRILAAGFQLYLRKPVAPEELGQAVRDLEESANWRSR